MGVFSYTTNFETNSNQFSEPVSSIEISLEEADLSFRQSEDGTLRVDCFEREKVKHNAAIENGTLKNTVVDNRKWYDHLLFFSFRSPSVTVYLPAEHYEALTIAADMGDLTLPERFSIERDTGDVRFESCDAGQITVKTSTGDVTGTLRTEKVFLTKRSTGAVDVPESGTGSKCEITTSTGDISIQIQKP